MLEDRYSKIYITTCYQLFSSRCNKLSRFHDSGDTGLVQIIYQVESYILYHFGVVIKKSVTLVLLNPVCRAKLVLSGVRNDNA